MSDNKGTDVQMRIKSHLMEGTILLIDDSLLHRNHKESDLSHKAILDIGHPLWSFR